MTDRRSPQEPAPRGAGSVPFPSRPARSYDRCGTSRVGGQPVPPIRSTVARPLVRPEREEDRFLPEGPRPLTLAGRDALAWVNIQTAADARSGAIHVRFWDTGERKAWPLPDRPGFLLPTTRPGVLLVGAGKAVGTLDLGSGAWAPLATVPDDNPRTIVNDGEVVPGGRAVVFGTKDTLFKDPVAGLYLFTLDDNAVSLVADRQTCSNGKVFARRGGDLALYDIDTPTRRVVEYRIDLQRRSLTRGGTALDLATAPGFPDGMCDGTEGTLIVAFYDPDPVDAGRAVRYELGTGRAVEEWRTPGSPRVTCPCLVRRRDAVKLVLTTAVEGMPADHRRRCPEAGSVFIADTDLSACPPVEPVRL